MVDANYLDTVKTENFDLPNEGQALYFHVMGIIRQKAIVLFLFVKAIII